MLSKYSYFSGRCHYAPSAASVVWIGVCSVSRRLDSSRVGCQLDWFWTTAGIRSCV